MTAGRADAVRRDEHARTRNEAFVDYVAERDVGEIMRIWETAPDIAHTGETGLDRGFGVGDHFKRELGDVFVQHVEAPFVVVAGKVGGQVRVCIHESGR